MMMAKVSYNKVFCFFTGIIILALSIFLFNEFATDFVSSCKCGTIIVFLCIFNVLVFKRKIITPSVIIFLFFIFFQYGRPLMIAFDQSYYMNDYYLPLYSEENLMFSSIFTVYCIQAYQFGFLFGTKEFKKKSKSLLFSNNNVYKILSVFRLLFFVSLIVAIPLSLYEAYNTIVYSYGFTKMDPFGIKNSFTNAMCEFFIFSSIILIVYSKNKLERKMVVAFLMLYAFNYTIQGSRHIALAILVVLAYYFYKKLKITNFTKSILFVCGIVVIAVLSQFVGKVRHYGYYDYSNFFSIILDAIGEMGFNFTSIVFTKEFVPSVESYRYGMTYVDSIICLIPSSLDFFGLLDNIVSAEVWLGNVLHAKYGTFYDFGVGYSVIAESYLNFGFMGFISVFVQAYIIQRLFSLVNTKNTKFTYYIELILLYSLITYPRRSINTLFKTIEYCILLVMVIIFIANSLVRRSNKYEQKCIKYN